MTALCVPARVLIWNISKDLLMDLTAVRLFMLYNAGTRETKYGWNPSNAHI